MILLFLMIFFSQLFGFESHEYEILKKNLKKDSVIIEAGAYDGYHTKMLAAMVPKGQVFSFEPFPRMFNIAKMNLKDLKNVHLYPIALAKKTGSTEFHISCGKNNDDYLGSSSVLEPTEQMHNFFPKLAFQQKIIVPCTTIDKFISDKKINQIDFIWLDLQGAELEVLRASPKTLEITKLIKTEVSYAEIYQNSGTAKDLIDFMKTNNFQLILLTGEGDVQGDAYFKKI